MSIKAMNWAWGQQGMGAATKLALMALADNADDGGVCWPGKKYVANKTGLSDSTIQRAFRDLQTAALLEVAPQFREDGGQTSNLYRLLLDTPPPSHHDAPPSHRDPEGAPPATPQEPPTNHQGTILVSPSPQEPTETPENWPDSYKTLKEIKSFTVPLEKYQEWLDRKGISENQAELTACAVKAKWNPKTHTDPWATFRQWVQLPLLRARMANGTGGNGYRRARRGEPPRDPSVYGRITGAKDW